MPFVSRNRQSKESGLQTYSKATKLIAEIRDAEIEYLDVRDWYMNELSRLAQFNEALEQAKNSKNKSDIAEFSNKVRLIEAGLKDVRNRVRLAGERSFAESFLIAARLMLNKEAYASIEEQAQALIGRPRHELS